jgi:D-alanine transaminase
MTATVYLNGRYLPDDQALVNVLDRGFVFGDGVYEVIPAYWGRPFRLEQHLDRLSNSLHAIRLHNPLTQQQWSDVIDALLRYNSAGDSMSIYLQITRGPAKREHLIPKQVKPTVFAMCNPITPLDSALLRDGASVATLEDIRWKYCHIKAITLLASVLLRQEALERGALDAILVRDGHVTEGTASNVFIVRDGSLFTPPNHLDLLPGVTRDVVLELARQHDIRAEEACITESDLQHAQEIWLTSSTREIVPVTRLNGKAVGDGKPGALWRRMVEYYQQFKHSLRSAP